MSMPVNQHSFTDAEPHQSFSAQLPFGYQSPSIDHNQPNISPPLSHTPSVFLGVANPFLHTNVPAPDENHALDTFSDADDYNDPADELNKPQEKVDKRVAVPIGINYTIWVKKNLKTIRSLPDGSNVYQQPS
jgi:hypothetical protein